jgi:hypothetical protein
MGLTPCAYSCTYIVHNCYTMIITNNDKHNGTTFWLLKAAGKPPTIWYIIVGLVFGGQLIEEQGVHKARRNSFWTSRPTFILYNINKDHFQFKRTKELERSQYKFVILYFFGQICLSISTNWHPNAEYMWNQR